jgi:hypothetical protein
MTRYSSDDDQGDELEYEPFDDVEWTDPDDLDAIDLDELDDANADEESAEHTGDEDESAEDAVATRPPSPRRRAARSAGSRPGSRRTPDSAQDSTPETAPDADSEADAGAALPGESAAEAAGASAEASAPDSEPTSEAESEAAPETSLASETKADDTTADTTVEKTDDESAAEEGADAAEVAETGEPEPPPEPVIPPDVYCAVLALPPEVGAGVLELRTTGEIEDMPPPGVILTPHFRTHDLEAVTTALADWTRIHLPMQLEIMAIKAEIIGAQQYIAAWTLDPQEELQDAIHALKRALADLILPMPGTTTTIGPHIMIGDHVPARRYPHLISQMQDSFETHVWQSTDLQLMRCVPANESDNGSGDGAITWELHRQFD